MNKIIALIAAVLVLGGGIFFLSTHQSKKSSSNKPAPTTAPTKKAAETKAPTASTEGAMTKTYTLDDVAKHTTADDCWLAIEGKVYDVTKFIPRHPGGKAILQGCGKDATAMFNSRPNDGTSHSQRARDRLPNYYVGDLKQ